MPIILRPLPDKLVAVLGVCIAITIAVTCVAVTSINQQKSADRTHASNAQMDRMTAAIHDIDQMVNETLSDLRTFTLMNRAWITHYVADKPQLLQNQSGFFQEWNDTLFNLWSPMVAAEGVPRGFGFNAQFHDVNGNPVPLTWQAYVDPWYNGSVFESMCGAEFDNGTCVVHGITRDANDSPRYDPHVQSTMSMPITWTTQKSFNEALLPWLAGDGTSYWLLTHQSDFTLNGRHVNIQTFDTTLGWASRMAASLQSTQECIIFDSNKYPITVHVDDPAYTRGVDDCFRAFAVNFTTEDECLKKPGDTHYNAAVQAMFWEAFPSASDLLADHALSMGYRNIQSRGKLFAMKTLVSRDHLHLHVVCMEDDARTNPMEATKASMGLGVPTGLLILLMTCLAAHLHRERKARQHQDDEAVNLTANIAEAMCQYDLEHVDMLLDAYCADVGHDSKLVKPLRDLRNNLGEYRPFLPRYLLAEDGSTGKRTSATSETLVSGHSSSSLLHKSNDSSRSYLLESVSPTEIVRHTVVAAADFVGSIYHINGTKSKLSSAAAIDAAALAVHTALSTTGGVLHCFIGDSVVASWNAVREVLQPEKKACRFLCSLRSDSSLKHLQITGACASGDAACHAGGDTKQRSLVVSAPAVFAQLDVARRFSKEGDCVIAHSGIRSGAKTDFKMIPYNIHSGAVFYEILEDLSEDTNCHEEWMYRVAKTENATDDALERVAQLWAAGRLNEARAAVAVIVTDDLDISCRLSSIAARIQL